MPTILRSFENSELSFKPKFFNSFCESVLKTPLLINNIQENLNQSLTNCYFYHLNAGQGTPFYNCNAISLNSL